ncbi:hypothetical protein N44_01979 [Microcystis aeruginosa NIES-44]|uniref:Uncharacterized protein n=1 Tax=Microcystis aeruginosa NIES-44 TaxID=449439 RepID=A0A0A1VTZ6_MICAE|nr:hypothetical protein N44_01979 [Microcystis aeruginosa NIES-44]
MIHESTLPTPPTPPTSGGGRGGWGKMGLSLPTPGHDEKL